MRKLFSMQIELRVLRTIALEPDSKATNLFLAKLDETYFASEVARATFKRIRHSLKRTSSIPSWDELVSDPNIDESIQDVLEECDYEALTSKKRVDKAIDRLQEYKKLRILTKIGKRLERAINGTDPINVDNEIEGIQSELATTRAASNFRILRIGVNSNVMKSVDRLLKGTSITYIPTGFDGFDSINRGIPNGSFFLVAGPTGSGKSLLLNQLGENFAKAGAKVGISPLEMSNDEMLQRNVARVGKFDMTKLLDPQNRLSKKEHIEIREKFAAYDKKILKSGGSLEFYEFDEDITIETLTSTVKPFDLDVLGIDYLGLLDGASGDDQWRALMNIARYCHVWGKSNKTTVMAAAQLSDDGALRYSKGLAEHAKYFWNWTVDEVSKQTGIFEIQQRKARQASDHSFPLHFNMPMMTVKDATKEAIEDAQSLRKESKKARGEGDSTNKKWKKEGNLSWDDDDEPAPRPGKKAQHHNIKSGSNGKRPAKREIEL